MNKSYELTIVLIILAVLVVITGWLCETYSYLKLPLFYLLFLPLILIIALVAFIIINNEINKPNERKR